MKIMRTFVAFFSLFFFCFHAALLVSPGENNKKKVTKGGGGGGGKMEILAVDEEENQESMKMVCVIRNGEKGQLFSCPFLASRDIKISTSFIIPRRL